MSPAKVQSARIAPLPLLSRLVLRVATAVAEWEVKRQTRKSLARLDPHILRDIGVDPFTLDRRR